MVRFGLASRTQANTGDWKMTRVILLYGSIAGAIVTAIMLLSIGSGVHSIVLG